MSANSSIIPTFKECPQVKKVALHRCSLNDGAKLVKIFELSKVYTKKKFKNNI